MSRWGQIECRLLEHKPNQPKMKRKKRPKCLHIKNMDGGFYFHFTTIVLPDKSTQAIVRISSTLPPPSSVPSLSPPLFPTLPFQTCGFLTVSAANFTQTAYCAEHWPRATYRSGKPTKCVFVFMCLCEAVNQVPLSTSWALQERLWWSHCNEVGK